MSINVTFQTIGELLMQNAGMRNPVAGGTLRNNLVLPLVAVGTAQILVQRLCPCKQLRFSSMTGTAE